MKLPHDATLRSVLATLQRPEEQVRQILENLTPCRKAHGNAHVRIGRTGEGKLPYHQVFYYDENGVEQIYGSYDGKNLFQESQDKSGWSIASTSRDEVMVLLGEIRSSAR